MGAVVGESAVAGTGNRRWAFGTVEFDERSFELRVNGEPVELEPKPLEVLLHLLRHAGEIVTKEELMAAVWPGRILTDNSLPKSISRIREVIGDDEQTVIKTVHGYGYRLVAPVTVQTAKAAPALTRLDLKPGDHPPLRPLWSLVERLGVGGQGEVWLVRHDKTREQRVFKFALDVAGLAAIKREITLYRFLRETLEGRDEFTRVLDWNLEEAPYYIELEHGAGGNLEEWAESVGGLAAIPIATRLELVAQIAEALAAAHSVGVLHKDLKPSNVLVLSSPLPPQGGEVGAQSAPGEGRLRIKLTDFGSGGVLDPARLEALGITRLGFTQSIMQGEAAATAMYLAPEVMSGQPATVQADVYALGILLYQVVAGDLKRPLAPGWEQRIDDPLLCEDIAQAVAGEPTRRLADASTIATRLRTLDERRRQRAEEHAEKLRFEQEQKAAQERARKAEAMVERLRTRRAWQRTVLAILIVAVSTSLGLFLQARQARNEAAAAAASSQAVADFLSKDMFAVVSNRPVRDLTVKELLDFATESLRKREGQMPQAAAQIYLALGDAFWAMNSVKQSEEHLEEALLRYERSGDIMGAAQAAGRLVKVKVNFGAPTSVLPLYRDIYQRARKELGSGHPVTLQLASELAFAQFVTGEWRASAEAFRALVADAKTAREVDGAFFSTAEERLVTSLVRIGEFQEAANAARAFVTRIDASQEKQSLAAGAAHGLLSHALIELEEFAEAETELQRAFSLVRPWTPDPSSGHLVSLQCIAAELNLRRRNHAEAIRIGLEAIETIRAWSFNPARLDLTPTPLLTVARAYVETRKAAEAVAMADRAVASSERVFGSGATTQYARIVKADALRLAGQLSEAHRALSAVDRKVLDHLGTDHPYVADLLRAEGLLALTEGKREVARKALSQAGRIYELRYGSGHLFARRARADLASAR